MITPADTADVRQYLFIVILADTQCSYSNSIIFYPFGELPQSLILGDTLGGFPVRQKQDPVDSGRIGIRRNLLAADRKCPVHVGGAFGSDLRYTVFNNLLVINLTGRDEHVDLAAKIHHRHHIARIHLVDDESGSFFDELQFAGFLHGSRPVHCQDQVDR